MEDGEGHRNGSEDEQSNTVEGWMSGERVDVAEHVVFLIYLYFLVLLL